MALQIITRLVKCLAFANMKQHLGKLHIEDKIVIYGKLVNLTDSLFPVNINTENNNFGFNYISVSQTASSVMKK